MSERQISLIEADLDDPLIDLQMSDIIDVVSTFSSLAASTRDVHTFVPKLFTNEPV